MRLFTCRFGSFLIIRAELDSPLEPPLRLFADGIPLDKPYLGVPLAGTRDFFLVARAPATLTKAATLELQDSAGARFDWAIPPRTASATAWSKRVAAPDSLTLLNTLFKNFTGLFGEQPADFWLDLIQRIGGRIDSTTITLADGRSYFRISHHRQKVTPGVVPLRFLRPGQSEPNPDSVGLLDPRYLHGLLAPRFIEAAGPRPLFIQWNESVVLPLITTPPANPAVSDDPLAAILAVNPGDTSALEEFLRHVGGIRPPLNADDRALAEGLRSRITALEGRTLVGWAVDINRPGEHIAVGISVNGQLLGTAQADLPIGRSRGEEPAGNHGFAYVLPAKLLDGKEHTIRLTLPNRPDYTTGQSFKIGSAHFDSDYQLEGGRRIAGWLRERCLERRPATVTLYLDGSATSHRQVAQGRNAELGKFEFELPHGLQDGAAHTARITVQRDGRELAQLGDPLAYQARYRGALVKLDATLVAGWIVNESAPELPIALDMHVNGIKEFTAETKPVRDRNGRGVFGFTFYLDVPKSGERYRSIAFYVAGTRHRVLGPDRILTQPDSILESLNKATGLLRSTDPDGRTHEWVRRQVLEPLIGELRKSSSLPASLTLNFNPVIQAVERRPAAEIIDVVVPAHSGLAQTLACLDSLEAANPDRRYEVV
ncbi:MAG: hypothetical protein FIA97_07250, partial [Methylococcaceae bacterium]|nr:hypothetical protein [Methylococcaceae bacterium]